MSAAPTVTHQLVLPGQAAAPEGPCDLNAMYVIHHGFRRDLDRFTRAVSGTPLTDLATWGALLERWDRFAHLLHEHHGKEDDVIWPLLLSRVDAARDQVSREVLVEMEAEHAVIDPVLHEVRGLLVELAAGAEEPARAGLSQVVRRATQVLGHHLAHEERDAIAVLQRYVAAAEWDRLQNKELRGQPRPSELLYFLPWVAEGLDPEVRAFLLRQAGVAFRILLRVGQRRFADLETRAFKHAGC